MTGSLLFGHDASAVRKYSPVAGHDEPTYSREPLQLGRLGSERAHDLLCKVLIAIGLAVLIGWLAIQHGTVDRWFRWPETHWGNLFWIQSLLFGGMMYAALGWRLVLWRRYRPMACVSDAHLPSLTVLIPCFNEGPLVGDAIRAAAASRYPADRLEIIVIDDGSTDNSWLHILTAAREVRDRVNILTLRHPKNLGKRRALYLGLQRGRGEIVVTLDSDSILQPDALRNGVAPLVRDRRVGCVAGCVEVLNPDESVFTRFLKCSFSLSFKFVRAYQNEFRGVFCTPGALSFYRAEEVRRVADVWLNQRFLGCACTTGEDRALTNLFLERGWLTAYQQNAVVRSRMPTTYAGLCGMFLRWARSNVRETVVLFRFMFTRFRREHLHAFRFNMLLATMALVLPPLLIVNSFMMLLTRDDFLTHQIGIVLTYSLLFAFIYNVNERDSDWLWLIAYEFFWVTCLWWILPYAFLTLRNTGWLTRRADVGVGNPSRERSNPGSWVPEHGT